MDAKVPANGVQNKTNSKVTVTAIKSCVSKLSLPKETTMSTRNVSQGEEQRTELLGSLTTQQQQRTSARVIKKLRLESPADKRDVTECDTTNKMEGKEPLKFPIQFPVKQRMPKALWSADEKSLFFEALNEYGKDFDAITAYICAKMKKRGMADGLKTKTQVSHFYYRTWHKLSKHVHFDENVKKVAQELYALINYGELRRKLASVSEKTCARLGEMVRGGSMAVRARGRTLRVRTPMCAALRRLNQITERACGTRVCSRAQVVLRARNACSWARVQAAAHNPRMLASLPLRTRLAAFIRALQKRWKTSHYKETLLANGFEKANSCPEDYERDAPDFESHLHLETDRIIAAERALPKKLSLHLGPRPGVEIHLPVLSPSEQLSSQKICFSSYLERMGALPQDNSVKIRTPKRQRKDSTSEKEKDESKKSKVDEDSKLVNIDETAIDGIEVMAHFRRDDDEEKPSEDEKEAKEEAVEEERAMSEREKDSHSELEDEEKYNDTDNESDGRVNANIKFRIRPKKSGGAMDPLVGKDSDEIKVEELKVEEIKGEEESKPVIDVETAIRQIRAGWSQHDAGDLTVGDLYLMFGSRSELELDYWWAEATPPLPQPIRAQKAAEGDKPERADRREKGNKTPEKGESYGDDEREKSDTDVLFSPKNTFSQDSNDGMSGDERKCEALLSPDHKSSGTLKLVSKLINRGDPQPALHPPDGFSLLSDRLKRLLALAGNANVPTGANTPVAKCNCGHVCPKKQAQKVVPQPAVVPKIEYNSVFRHPTPIAPRPYTEKNNAMCLDGLPRRRRGRPRVSERDSPRVVVQRLLPLLPKLPPTSNLIPVKLVANSSPPALPRILPKPPPPPPTSTAELSAYYVLSESNGRFFFHDGDRRIPINPPEEDDADTINGDDEKEEASRVKKETDAEQPISASVAKSEQTDMTSFLTSESMSLSPSRLLRDADGWLEGSVQDFSLSSFLNQLEGRHPDTAVESQLHSLMAESSVDYVAKFASLAAEVTEQRDDREDVP